MSRLWLILGSLFTIAAVLGGTYGVVNALARDTTDAHDVIAADEVEGVRVEMHDGAIELLGDDSTDEITIDATIQHGLQRTTYDVDVVDGIVVIDSDCPVGPPFWCHADITVRMPPHVPVEVDGRNGRVRVRDLTADVTIDTSNGSIDVRRLTGALDLHTSNAPVTGQALAADTVRARTSNGTIELAFSEAPVTVDAHTSNSPIDIEVPIDDNAYAIDADTNSFGTTDLAIRTDPDGDRTITAHTSNGPIDIHYPTS